jgi:hypothetical protein
MTNQELFDRVVAHARQQKCKASLGLTCYYHHTNGTKCFIGALIPDDKYLHSFEGCGLGPLLSPEAYPNEDITIAKNIATAAGIEESQYELAQVLQSVHDISEQPEWENHFTKIAAQYNLTYTPPTE